MEKATSNKKPFIQFIRNSKEFYALIRERPTAFVLLAIIADRARRTGEMRFDDCVIGEAEIGDTKTYNSTEQKYKTDKKYLEKHGFATFKPTNKGTIAKIISTSIFDINAEKQTNKLTTNQRASNDQPTTNNNDKNGNNDKQLKHDKNYLIQVPSSDLQIFTQIYLVTEAEVQLKAEELSHYCEAKGKSYKNYKSLLTNALLRQYGKRNMEYSQAGYRIVR